MGNAATIKNGDVQVMMQEQEYSEFNPNADLKRNRCKYGFS
jgi:hypothetical protein